MRHGLAAYRPVYPARETNSIRASVTSNSIEQFCSGSLSFLPDSPPFDRSMIDVEATQQYIPKNHWFILVAINGGLWYLRPEMVISGYRIEMVNNISVSHSQIHHQT